tara:strand:+ start:227 stop:919 length:693 start_codon:yes stop_codon:yes gene_type:complete
MNIRISKYLSSAGFCSRRDAEKLIFEKKIKINNQICSHPSQKVNNLDIIKVNNKIIKKTNRIELWKLYKPIKYICSTKDNLNRKKIFDLLPKNLGKLISVGRLDYMSEGLILLTNSGDFSRYLEHPSSNIERTYRVCIHSNIKNNELQKINKGIRIKGVEYNKVHVVFEKKLKNHNWLIFKLKEGKNREIRNICNYFSWNIIKLIRIGYGSFKLGKLKEGQFQKLKNIGK